MPQPVTCVIAARYRSSRFEGKPLAMIHGKPMILWVVEHATKAQTVSSVVVATDDGRIYDVVTEAGYQAVYTSEDCPNGSARVAEAAEGISDEWIFEMQGDQPLVTPEIIDSFVMSSFGLIAKKPEIDVVIPFAQTTPAQTASPDILKAVVTASNRIVFQTRHPIETGFRTLGLYMWKRDVLYRFASTGVSHVEKVEDSHPIRLYVNDVYVQGVHIKDSAWVEVDRPEHISEVEQIMSEKGIVS